MYNTKGLELRFSQYDDRKLYLNYDEEISEPSRISDDFYFPHNAWIEQRTLFNAEISSIGGD